MKVAVNLSTLFSELPHLDRFDAAAEAGFDAVELPFPYDDPAPETQRALQANGLSMVQITAPPPNYTGGVRGFAAQPGAADRFRYDMRRVLRYLDAFGARHVEILAGDAEGADAFDCLVSNLTMAADSMPAGVALSIAPSVPETHPNAFLQDYGLVQKVLRAVNRPNVGLLFDTYDAAQIEGDAVACFERHAADVRFIRLADSPARRAPTRGNIDFESFFQAVRDSGYEGWMSAAYAPGPKVADTLRWRELVL